MLHIDVDRWRTDPDVVARIQAAARRERAEMMQRYLASLRGWLMRDRRRAPAWARRYGSRAHWLKS